MIQIQIKNLAEVPEALSLVKGEVEKVKKAINEAGAKALREDKRTIAREALDYADGLDAFIGKITALGAEWEKLEKTIANATPEAREIVRKAGGTRIVEKTPEPKTNFVVEFPDGTIIHDSVAAKTLAKTIEKLGPAKVAALKNLPCMRLAGEPLVTDNADDYCKFPSAKEPIRGGWFVKTHSSTQTKANAIIEIAKALKIKLKVKIVAGTFVGSKAKPNPNQATLPL